MSTEYQEEVWEMKPRKLTAEEIGHPEQVISEFFQYAHLPQVRACLWEGLKTLVAGNYVELKRKERANMLHFYEQLEKLMEVIHVIYVTRIRPNEQVGGQ